MNMPMETTREIAEKVLATVDAGLCAGQGIPEPGKMCVEAAVCFAFGLPHGDNPPCVDLSVRDCKISLNDAGWSSNQTRAAGLRELSVLQLGSVGHVDKREFAYALLSYLTGPAVNVVMNATRSGRGTSDFTDALQYAALRCTEEPERAIGSMAVALSCAANVIHEGPERDSFLRGACYHVAGVLRNMNVPGVQWLPLLHKEQII